MCAPKVTLASCSPPQQGTASLLLLWKVCKKYQISLQDDVWVYFLNTRGLFFTQECPVGIHTDAHRGRICWRQLNQYTKSCCEQTVLTTGATPILTLLHNYFKILTSIRLTFSLTAKSSTSFSSKLWPSADIQDLLYPWRNRLTTLCLERKGKE